MEWVDRKLGDVCRLINGRAYKKHEMLSQGPYPLLRVGNFFTNRSWYYSDMELQADKYCDDGDLLYAWSASFGPRIWAGGKVIYHYHIWKIEIDKDLVDKKYLYYLLDWDKELIKSEQGAGTTMVHVTKGSMEKRMLPFPFLEEQKRIVAILDQAFADLEQTRAKTEQNLKNARELFDSSLKNVFESKGAHWERISLLELLERKYITSHLDGNHGGAYPRKNEFIDSGVPYISAKCLIDGKVDMTKAKYLSAERAGALRKGIAKDEDVLFAHNATVGPVAILDTTEEKVILGTSLTYYRCNKKYINPKYLAQYMISFEFTSQYTSIMRQSTRNQVPITKQREFIHIIPPIDEQEEIAESLSALSYQLKKLELVYKEKLFAIDELKKSILQKAFSGELTTTAE